MRPWQTARDVKATLQRLLHIPAARIRLFARGRELRNARPLADGGVDRDGQTLLFAVRPANEMGGAGGGGAAGGGGGGGGGALTSVASIASSLGGAALSASASLLSMHSLAYAQHDDSPYLDAHGALPCGRRLRRLVLQVSDARLGRGCCRARALCSLAGSRAHWMKSRRIRRTTLTNPASFLLAAKNEEPSHTHNASRGASASPRNKT